MFPFKVFQTQFQKRLGWKERIHRLPAAGHAHRLVFFLLKVFFSANIPAESQTHHSRHLSIQFAGFSVCSEAEQRAAGQVKRLHAQLLEVSDGSESLIGCLSWTSCVRNVSEASAGTEMDEDGGLSAPKAASVSWTDLYFL